MIRGGVRTQGHVPNRDVIGVSASQIPSSSLDMVTPRAPRALPIGHRQCVRGAFETRPESEKKILRWIPRPAPLSRPVLIAPLSQTSHRLVTDRHQTGVHELSLKNINESVPQQPRSLVGWLKA